MHVDQYKQMFAIEDTHWWFVAKRNFIKQQLPQKTSLNILDLGCGTGGTTAFLQHWGKVTAIEENSLAIKLAKKRKLNIIKQNINRTLPFKDNTFDVISLFDVLYHQHIHTEEGVLNEAQRILKKSGTLLITDCAHPSLISHHDKSVMAKKRFTKTNLNELVEKSGFRIKKSTYVFCSTFPFFVVDRLIQKTHKSTKKLQLPPTLINFLLIKILACEAYLSRYINLPIGSSILISATKP